MYIFLFSEAAWLVHHHDARAHLYISCRRRRRIRPVKIELISQIAVATRLKHAAQPERPGDDVGAQEKVAHLHAVPGQPVGDDGQSEALAGSGVVVLEDLWERQDGFDGETGVAEEGDVGPRAGDEGEQELDGKQGGGHVREELVVARTHVSLVGDPCLF